MRDETVTDNMILWEDFLGVIDNHWSSDVFESLLTSWKDTYRNGNYNFNYMICKKTRVDQPEWDRIFLAEKVAPNVV